MKHEVYELKPGTLYKKGSSWNVRKFTLYQSCAYHIDIYLNTIGFTKNVYFKIRAYKIWPKFQLDC